MDVGFKRGCCLSAILVVLAAGLAPQAEAAASLNDWPQWGGPSREFKSAVTGLADHWPAGANDASSAGGEMHVATTGIDTVLEM